MSAAPLPTTGIVGRISETGGATIEVPMFVEIFTARKYAGTTITF